MLHLFLRLVRGQSEYLALNRSQERIELSKLDIRRMERKGGDIARASKPAPGPGILVLH